MSILQTIGIIFTGVIVLVFLFRWILMVEKIIEEQKKSFEKTLNTAGRLVEFIDKNIKERVVYTSRDSYDNADKFDEVLPEGEMKEDEAEEMTMEAVQDIKKIKNKEEEGIKENG